MERFTPNTAPPTIDIQHRGSSGLWQTGYSWLSEIVEKGVLPACHEAGIPANADVNTPDGSLGATRSQTFIDLNGQRSSLATAYLSFSVLQRPNLYVASHARATRLLFDRLSAKEHTVIGVEFQNSGDGHLFQVHAQREVILCEGAINTPHSFVEWHWRR
jgi:choline dehydrogenase